MKKVNRVHVKNNGGRGGGRGRKATQNKDVEETVSTPSSQPGHPLTFIVKGGFFNDFEEEKVVTRKARPLRDKVESIRSERLAGREGKSIYEHDGDFDMQIVSALFQHG